MVKKLLVVIPLVLFAFLVLFISIMRTASLRYDYNGVMSTNKGYLSTVDTKIDYSLPYPGSILPDHPLWSLKVVRDRVWYGVTTKDSRKIELSLLFADKRLGSSKILFEQNNYNLGIATLEKSQRYLLEASLREESLRRQGADTRDVSDRLARASLRHYEVMLLMYESVPEEVRPAIVSLSATPKKVYENSRNAQLGYGMSPYPNPFDWE